MLARLATERGIASVGRWRPFAVAGGLASFGEDPSQLFTRVATFADKVLRGGRISDLPWSVPPALARLGVAPHVADKILNHQIGTISGVAAVYQRHEFLKERKQALDLWGEHVLSLGRAAVAA